MVLFSCGSSASPHQGPTLHLLREPTGRTLLGSVWSEEDQCFSSTSSSLSLGQFRWSPNVSVPVVVSKGLPYAGGLQEFSAAAAPCS